MSISCPAVKRLLVLCLLVFQAQVLASGLLGCRHAGAPAAGEVEAGCPFHHVGHTTPADKSAPAPPLDCAKCALQIAMGAAAPMTSSPVPVLMPIPARLAPGPHAHFYRFTPEADFRPPIDRLL
jgi:hypothetical protein